MLVTSSPLGSPTGHRPAAVRSSNLYPGPAVERVVALFERSFLGVAFFWVAFLRAAVLEGAVLARDFFFRAVVFGAARFFGGFFPVL